MEMVRGLDGHNLVTAAMYEHNLDIHGAVQWAESYARDIIANFLEDLEHLPNWNSETNRKVNAYIDGLGRIVRGYDCWSFETKRYYGDRGLDVQKSRWVSLNDIPGFKPKVVG